MWTLNRISCEKASRSSESDVLASAVHVSVVIGNGYTLPASSVSAKFIWV